MHLRVVSGRFRGRRLRSPRGRGTRPSSGRTRQGVMNILGTERLEGASVLDLYAGTGAVGVEALSRGAARVLFVERERGALEALRRNLGDLGLGGEEARVLAADAVRALRGPRPLAGGPFDLVFCDPPYSVFRDPAAERDLREALGVLAAKGGITPGGTVVVEHPAEGGFAAPPPGLREVDRRAYSAAGVGFFRPLS